MFCYSKFICVIKQELKIRDCATKLSPAKSESAPPKVAEVKSSGPAKKKPEPVIFVLNFTSFQTLHFLTPKQFLNSFVNIKTN